MAQYIFEFIIDAYKKEPSSSRSLFLSDPFYSRPVEYPHEIKQGDTLTFSFKDAGSRDCTVPIKVELRKDRFGQIPQISLEHLTFEFGQTEAKTKKDLRSSQKYLALIDLISNLLLVLP